MIFDNLFISQFFWYHWLQYVFILFLILFFTLFVQIAWWFHLPIVMEVFQVVIFGLLDITEQLCGPIYSLWSLRCLQPCWNSAFITLQSCCLLYPVPVLPLLGRFSCNNIPSMDLSIAHCVVTQSLFLDVAHVSLACNITGKMILLKRFENIVLYTFAFIVVNAFLSVLSFPKISASISWHIFTLSP